jgi:tRNA pseudouridine55 synthase
VTIHQLTIVSWDDTDPERPVAVVDIQCSAGTYIRALARDLGEALGTAAYLGALTRTASGSFRLEDATSLDAIRSAAADGPAGLAPYLRPVDAGLDHLPEVSLTEPEVRAISKGQFVRPATGIPAAADHYRLRSPDGALIGIASALGGRLAPDKVFVSPVPAVDPEVDAVNPEVDA